MTCTTFKEEAVHDVESGRTVIMRQDGMTGPRRITQDESPTKWTISENKKTPETITRAKTYVDSVVQALKVNSQKHIRNTWVHFPRIKYLREKSEQHAFPGKRGSGQQIPHPMAG